MVAHKVKNRYRPGEYYRYYACGNYTNKGIKTCKTNLVKADYAEEYVLREIKKLVNDPEIVNSIVKELKKNNDIDTEPMKKEIRKIKKELDNIKEEKKEFLNAKINKEISMKTYTESVELLNQNESELAEKLFKIDGELNSIESHGTLETDFVTHILQNFMKLFEVADIKQRKQLLHSFIDRITVNQGEKTNERTINKITLFFEPQELEALSKQKKFVPTYDRVRPS